MNFVNFVKNATILTVIVVLALQSMSIERMRSRIVALEQSIGHITLTPVSARLQLTAAPE